MKEVGCLSFSILILLQLEFCRSSNFRYFFLRLLLNQFRMQHDNWRFLPEEVGARCFEEEEEELHHGRSVAFRWSERFQRQKSCSRRKMSCLPKAAQQCWTACTAFASALLFAAAFVLAFLILEGSTARQHPRSTHSRNAFFARQRLVRIRLLTRKVATTLNVKSLFSRMSHFFISASPGGRALAAPAQIDEFRE